MEKPISGWDLRDARSRLEMSQREFAQLLHHGQRTIVAWERDGVPEHKVPLVRARLAASNALKTDDETGNEHLPLEAYSDVSLVMEIMRRLEARGQPDPRAGPPNQAKKRGRGAKKPDDQ